MQSLNDEYMQHSAILNFISKEKADEYFQEKDDIEKRLFDLCGNRNSIIKFQDKVDFSVFQLEKNLLYTFLEIGECFNLNERNYTEPFIDLSDMVFKINNGEEVFRAKDISAYVSGGRWEEDGEEFINKYTIKTKEGVTNGNNTKEG